MLTDETSLLWNESSTPTTLIPFSSRLEALEGLETKKVDAVISAESFDDNGMKATAALMTFQLCLLGTQRLDQPLLVIPEVPDYLRTALSRQSPLPVVGENSLYDNLRHMMRNEASGVVAPCFMTEQFMRRAPLSAFSSTVLSDLPGMSYRAWVLPSRPKLVAEINRLISHLDKRDVRGLEQRWGLPTGSIADQHTWMDGKNTGTLALRIALVNGHPPLVITDVEGSVSGVWREFLNALFPSTIFSLQLVNVDSKQQAEKWLREQRIDLIMGDTAFLPENDHHYIFDNQILGLVSLSRNPLKGDLPSLRNKRIAVVRNAPLSPLLNKILPAGGILMVEDISHGLALIEAGGADGMIADAFSLNYDLRRYNSTNLVLNGVDLPEVPLWFVLPQGNSALHERISDILEGVTADNILTYKSHWLAASQQEENSRTTLWLILSGGITVFAVILAIVIVARHFIRQRQIEQTHRQLSDALSLWQALLNNAPVPLFVCDPAGRVVRFNQAFANSSIVEADIKAGTLLPGEAGQPLAEWLDLPTRMATLYESKPRVDEITLTHLPHPVTLFRWLARYTDSDGVPQGMVGGWIDISDKAELETALNLSLAQAEKASEEKSVFLARMSHDIRTPLNVILGLLDIEREVHPSLELAWQASVTLRDLVGEILDLSRIEAGELQLQPDVHNLNQFLSATDAIFNASAQAKGLLWHREIQVAENTFCQFDHVRLNQVLANLLGNAIKYTEKGSVTFQARYVARNLHLTIIDTGIGIPPERYENIFQPWFQLDANTPYSSGLGLAICRQLITLMQGTLEVKSEPGKGTRVMLCLPLDTSTPPRAAITEKGEARSDALTGYRVILVDDFPPNLTVMSMQLIRLGHQVTACSTPTEALDFLRYNQADVLITDSQMPEMDGYKLVEKLILQSLTGDIHCPVLLLGCTANALRREEERALHAGMDALLRKPLSEDRLHQALSRFPQVAREEADLQEIYALAGQQQEMVELMLQQLIHSLDEDLEQLCATPADTESMARVAHRLKASWSLLQLHRAERYCLAIEKLPSMLAAGEVDAGEVPRILTHFIAEMRHSQRQLLNSDRMKDA
ncbi:ATP-binding protein [Erwinia sp. HDF1-3R]|uniref:ATP-binding protein n=1 Tax=Erwinia sp. HDF1-3R TaxID=3141543 RepID=UPI0031F536C1